MSVALEANSERERYILVAAIVIAATEGSWNIYLWMDGPGRPPPGMRAIPASS